MRRLAPDLRWARMAIVSCVSTVDSGRAAGLQGSFPGRRRQLGRGTARSAHCQSACAGKQGASEGRDLANYDHCRGVYAGASHAFGDGGERPGRDALSGEGSLLNDCNRCCRIAAVSEKGADRLP